MRRFLRPTMLLLVSGIFLGQTASDPSPQEVAEALRNPARAEEALAHIRQLFHTEPQVAAANTRYYWAKALADARRHRDAEGLALQAILTASHDLALVEAMQRQRVVSLQAMGLHVEALRESKSLFLVSSMAGTESALLTLAACLNGAHGSLSDETDRLIAEQRAGLGDEGRRSAVVEGIALEAGVYEEAIRARRTPTGELPASVTDLLAVVNLELLAGRVERAEEAVGRLMEVVEVEHLRTGHEAKARVMKARDGTVGRANGYVRGLRGPG